VRHEVHEKKFSSSSSSFFQLIRLRCCCIAGSKGLFIFSQCVTASNVKMTGSQLKSMALEMPFVLNGLFTEREEKASPDVTLLVQAFNAFTQLAVALCDSEHTEGDLERCNKLPVDFYEATQFLAERHHSTGWATPKMQFLNHAVECIRLFGSLSCCATDQFERAHQVSCRMLLSTCCWETRLSLNLHQCSTIARTHLPSRTRKATSLRK